MESKHEFTMCRLCLCENDIFNDIFHVNEWLGYVAADVITDLLQLEVSRTDCYPHVICSICLGKLMEFKQFKEQCQNSKDTYNNVFAADEIHDEHLADSVPSPIVKIEVEEEPNDVYSTTEVPSPIVKIEVEEEPNDVYSTTEVGKTSSSSEDLDGRWKRNHCESLGPNTRVDTGKIGTSLGEGIDTLSEEGRAETSDGNLRIENITSREEQICAVTSVDATLGVEETVKLEMESDNAEEEASLGVDETEGKRFICQDCGKEFPEKDVLLRHLELHGYVINEESYGEERDNNTYGNSGINLETDLRKGMMKMSDKVREEEALKKYVCDVCGQGFDWISSIKKHVKIHCDSKPRACDKCGKMFTNMFDLSIHKIVHADEKPYVCELCGMKFAKSYDLKDHRITRCGEKTYECDICGKKLSYRSTLRTHKRVHTGKKPYVCGVCGKGFVDKPGFVIHMRIHTGEKPYKCEVCGKAFSVNYSLKIHSRIHSGEKPYKCEICDKCFISKSCINRHLRVHSQEKPYACEVCNRSFSDRSNLVSHSRIHTREEPF